MICEHVSPQKWRTSRWSGGTTSELFLYPGTASYKKRDFQFRVSLATVNARESRFTSLPGISRILVLLKGKMNLHFLHHGDVHLDPYTKVEFSGDWDTRSTGDRTTDLNLMTGEGCTGDMEIIRILPKENRPVSFQKEWTKKKTFYGFFVAQGKVKAHIKENVSALESNDFLICSFEESDGDEYRADLSSCGQSAAVVILFRVSTSIS